jgi:hypothetical protein
LTICTANDNSRLAAECRLVVAIVNYGGLGRENEAAMCETAKKTLLVQLSPAPIDFHADDNY